MPAVDLSTAPGAAVGSVAAARVAGGGATADADGTCCAVAFNAPAVEPGAGEAVPVVRRTTSRALPDSADLVAPLAGFAVAGSPAAPPVDCVEEEARRSTADVEPPVIGDAGLLPGEVEVPARVFETGDVTMSTDPAGAPPTPEPADTPVLGIRFTSAIPAVPPAAAVRVT